jgi:hypothetical protein
MTEPVQYATYAAAYLDASIRLCSVLARSYRKATFERGSVVLFLMAHAFELYLKGAILRKAPGERFSHDLERLAKRYNALYTAKRFRFTHLPFQTEYFGMSTAKIVQTKKVQPPTNQRHRYPRDKSGTPWAGLFSFEANSCLQDLHTLDSDFQRLLKEYER